MWIDSCLLARGLCVNLFSQPVVMFYGGARVMGACLRSSFPLLRIKYVRYFMAFWCMDFMSFLIGGF